MSEHPSTTEQIPAKRAGRLATMPAAYDLKRTIDRHNAEHRKEQSEVSGKMSLGLETILAIEKAVAAGPPGSRQFDSLAEVLKDLRAEQEKLVIRDGYHLWLHNFFNELYYSTSFLEHLPPEPARDDSTPF